MKDFTKPLPQAVLDLEEKHRSNLFAWRGQFSPQLIESLLDAYCSPGSLVLDPFAGSGTVLLEAASMGLPAWGFEINPAAWSIAKLYEFANIVPDARDSAIAELRARIEEEFPIILFSDDQIPIAKLEEGIIRTGTSIGDKPKILCNALVVLLDVCRNRITGESIQAKFAALADLVRKLPFSPERIKADLQDTRALPLDNESVDFTITSPPYINVFNYHQNYRRSVEVLGWDILQVARSEIGSNRANRGNRFYTVIQYCIDMASALAEIARVLKPSGRAVLIVGHESRVLGAPFYNADIVEQIATQSGLFKVLLRQQRLFTSRFGEAIREDVLNLRTEACRRDPSLATTIGRAVAHDALKSALRHVPEKSRNLLAQSIERVSEVGGTPFFKGVSYIDYHTRDGVMVVRDE